MFIPQYQTEQAAAVDLIANIPGGSVIMPYRSIEIIDCGFSMELPEGYKSLIGIRSGLASRGMVVVNAPGVIDSDYRGRIKVIAANIGKEVLVVKHGERFAQMRVEPVYTFAWTPVSSLSETNRGEGGIGSTGV